MKVKPTKPTKPAVKAGPVPSTPKTAKVPAGVIASPAYPEVVTTGRKIQADEHKEKIEKAQRLWKEGRTMTEIANEVGLRRAYIKHLVHYHRHLFPYRYVRNPLTGVIEPQVRSS